MQKRNRVDIINWESYSLDFVSYLCTMSNSQPNNPLHGIKLATIVEDLVEFYGWESLADKIKINCFKSNQTIKSTLKFLRKTPWARTKVENLYVSYLKQKR